MDFKEILQAIEIQQKEDTQSTRVKSFDDYTVDEYWVNVFNNRIISIEGKENVEYNLEKTVNLNDVFEINEEEGEDDKIDIPEDFEESFDPTTNMFIQVYTGKDGTE
ncbi:hypothetical protein BB559_006350 [Furculomyces boomerangus]|uniref:Uncharacterized protein n=1 Tax=Furculomyces boomerangus TaxID=61424 RepID=A0A2T9Y3I3_9FUNG|nr:hypothetical protein BB559_006350 [Furculomyces boomerangus]